MSWRNWLGGGLMGERIVRCCIWRGDVGANRICRSTDLVCGMLYDIMAIERELYRSIVGRRSLLLPRSTIACHLNKARLIQERYRYHLFRPFRISAHNSPATQYIRTTRDILLWCETRTLRLQVPCLRSGWPPQIHLHKIIEIIMVEGD